MNNTFVQFVKFGIVGFSNTIISYVIYIYLIYINIPYVLSNIFAFIVGVLNSFFWNNRYVFKKNEGERRNTILTLFKTFWAYIGTGLILSNMLLIIFVEKCSISKVIAPIITLTITIPLNYIINKFWAYKTKKDS